MSCYASCAIAANLEDIRPVIEATIPWVSAALQDETRKKDPAVELEQGRLDSFYPPTELGFCLKEYGGRYVVLFKIGPNKSSDLVRTVYTDILKDLPAGSYHIAYTFAWDYDHSQAATLLSWDPYRGAGSDLPDCLDCYSEDYFGTEERLAMLREDGWREEDLPNESLDQLAMAASLRYWSKGAVAIQEDIDVVNEEGCEYFCMLYGEPEALFALFNWVENKYQSDEEFWGCFTQDSFGTDDHDQASKFEELKHQLVASFPEVGLKILNRFDGETFISEPGSNDYECDFLEYW